MVRLWGREYTRHDLLQRVGRIEQIGGVEAAVLDEGPARGTRVLRFSSASGLCATVLPDRCMDIQALNWHGRSLCWQSASGPVSPALFQPEHDDWTRSFFGGMLTTCGLTNTGPAGEDAGEQYPLHGLASSLPASEVAWGHSWDGDRCTLYARGMMRQWKLFAEHLTLTRHLSLDLDGETLRLEDVVRNEAHHPSPHMILYHCNGGFPLLDDGARLRARFASVEPRDEEARKGLDAFDRYVAPAPDFKEQVFITRPEPDTDGWNEVTLWNPALDGGLGLRLRFDAATLPAMFIWRMLGQGNYVLGLEPSNCFSILGRADARARGILPILQPGEERRYRLEFSVVPHHREPAGSA